MKTFFKSFVLVSAVIFSIPAIAQTKQEVFKGFDAILKKAEGQKVYARGLKALDKVTKQQFDESTVSVSTKNTFKGSSERTIVYTNIPWKDVYKYTIDTDNENEKVYEVTLYFDSDLKKSYIGSYSPQGDTDNTIFVKVYIRTKDFNDFDSQMKLLGKVIPNKIK